MAKKKRKKPASRWPAIRAAILTFVIVFNVIAAIPSPGYVTQSKLQTKTNQAELRRWVKILGDFGIDTDPKALGDWYIGFAASFEQKKAFLLTPITWWMDRTHTSQGWRLFGMPDERPFALQILAKSKTGDRVLYRSGEPEHDWQAGKFQFRRVRGLYNPGNMYAPSTYPGFAKQVSVEVFGQFDDVDEVVVSLWQSHTTRPNEPKDPTVEERYVHRFVRGTSP